MDNQSKLIYCMYFMYYQIKVTFGVFGFLLWFIWIGNVMIGRFIPVLMYSQELYCFDFSV